MSLPVLSGRHRWTHRQWQDHSADGSVQDDWPGRRPYHHGWRGHWVIAFEGGRCPVGQQPVGVWPACQHSSGTLARMTAEQQWMRECLSSCFVMSDGLVSYLLTAHHATSDSDDCTRCAGASCNQHHPSGASHVQGHCALKPGPLWDCFRQRAMACTR